MRRTLLRNLRAGLRAGLGAPLARRTAGNLAFRIAGAGMSFVAAVVLARCLGQAAYGAYVGWAATVALGATCLGFGLPVVALQEIAAARGRGEGWERARGALLLALATTLLVATGSALAGTALAWQAHGGALAPPFLAALTLAVLLLLGLVAAVQQGFEHVLRSQVPGLVQPVALVAGAVSWRLLGGHPLGLVEALLLQLGAAALALLVGLALLLAGLEAGERQALAFGPLAGRPGPWLATGFFLMANQLLVNAQTQLDILMLGWLARPEAVATYHAASRGAYVLTFLFGAATAALGPTVARLHAAGDRAGLAATVARSAGATFLVSAALALALALVGPFYLRLFGPGFAAGYPAFLVLLSGWLVCIACGPAQVVLLMTGEARAAALLFAGGTGLNLLLGFALIPLAGALGAAVAAATAVAAVGLAWGVRCRRRLGLSVSGLGALRHLRAHGLAPAAAAP